MASTWEASEQSVQILNSWGIATRLFPGSFELFPGSFELFAGSFELFPGSFELFPGSLELLPGPVDSGGHSSFTSHAICVLYSTSWIPNVAACHWFHFL